MTGSRSFSAHERRIANLSVTIRLRMKTVSIGARGEAEQIVKFEHIPTADHFALLM